MGAGKSTINTTLFSGTSAESLTKVCKIKSYPDLGSAPNTLQTTDLEDTSHTYTFGVQDTGSLEFTANYDATSYASVKAMAGTTRYFELRFGDAGADGKFTWQGEIDVYVTGGDVDAIREMVIVSVPSTVITFTGS